MAKAATYRKNLTLSLGPISTLVDLTTVSPETKSEINRICPDHKTKLNQQYMCQTDGGHTVNWGTWIHGVPTEDGYRVVDVDNRPTVEASTGLDLTPVSRKELDAATIDGTGLYYAEPSNTHSTKTWTLFTRLVDGNTALVTRGALRRGTGTEKLWRLSTFNGFLVLREIRYPENLKPAPTVETIKVPKDESDMFAQFATKRTVPWEQFDATDIMAQRVEAWKTDGTTFETLTPAAPEQDLKTLLAAALEL